MTRDEILKAIDSLQVWFAAKKPGWRETATPEQLQQWADREREQEYLIGRLEMLDELATDDSLSMREARVLSQQHPKRYLQWLRGIIEIEEVRVLLEHGEGGLSEYLRAKYTARA